MRITNIEEKSWKSDERYNYPNMDGFVITLESDNRETEYVKIGISNEQSCCEQWGYVTSEDNLSDFIGAQLFDVRIVDDALLTHNIKEWSGDFGDCGMFINLITSNGTLQFVMYNEHNGYYGHAVSVQSSTSLYMEHNAYI